MCNPLHLKERNNSEIPDTIDINRENTIVRLKAKVVEWAGNPWEEIKDGGIDMGTKGRKNVKKTKKQVLEKKAQKAEQKKK